MPDRARNQELPRAVSRRSAKPRTLMEAGGAPSRARVQCESLPRAVLKLYANWN
jgi:hypothetical protein